MKIKIEFNMDNAAFELECNFEMTRILETIKVQIHKGYAKGNCVDVNGNRVGQWGITE